MTAEDLFGVVVRLVGLALGLVGLLGFVGAGFGMAGLLPPGSPSQAGDAISAAIWLFLGSALFFGAGLIARAAYGRRKPGK
jgi:hypothetical protein